MRAGDQLGEDVLGDQDKPNEAVIMGENLPTKRRGQGPKAEPSGHGQQAGQHQRTDNEPQDVVPVIFVSQVKIGPAFQPIFDRQPQTENERRIAGEALEVGRGG